MDKETIQMGKTQGSVGEAGHETETEVGGCTRVWKVLVAGPEAWEGEMLSKGRDQREAGSRSRMWSWEWHQVQRAHAGE